MSKHLSSILVSSGSVPTITCRYYSYRGSIVTHNFGTFFNPIFKRVIKVPHYYGFKVCYTYANIGDSIIELNFGGLCVPKEDYDDFSKKWFASDIEDLIEFYHEYYKEKS